MRRRPGCVCLAALAFFVFPHTSAAVTLACNPSSNPLLLAGISNTTITAITPIPVSPVVGSTTSACRVRATIRPLGPTGDSVIGVELWLPIDGWNHRFLGIGNGGFQGNLPSGNQGARFGFATAGTDTGHTGGATQAGHTDTLRK